jgi:hypothetical protein
VRDGGRRGKQWTSEWIAETNCDYGLFEDGIAAHGRVASERIARLPKAWPDRRRLGIVLQKPKPEGITYAVKLMVAVQRSSPTTVAIPVSGAGGILSSTLHCKIEAGQHRVSGPGEGRAHR